MRALEAAVEALADRPVLVVSTARPELSSTTRRGRGTPGARRAAARHPRRRRDARSPRRGAPRRGRVSRDAGRRARALGREPALRHRVRPDARGHRRRPGRLDTPVSVQAVISARLDAIPAEARAVVLDAAVLGTRSGRRRSPRSAGEPWRRPRRARARGAAGTARSHRLLPPRERCVRVRARADARGRLLPPAPPACPEERSARTAPPSRDVARGGGGWPRRRMGGVARAAPRLRLRVRRRGRGAGGRRALPRARAAVADRRGRPRRPRRPLGGVRHVRARLALARAVAWSVAACCGGPPSPDARAGCSTPRTC